MTFQFLTDERPDAVLVQVNGEDVAWVEQKRHCWIVTFLPAQVESAQVFPDAAAACGHVVRCTLQAVDFPS